MISNLRVKEPSSCDMRSPIAYMMSVVRCAIGCYMYITRCVLSVNVYVLSCDFFME